MQSITWSFKQCLVLKTTILNSWIMPKIPNYILNHRKEKVRESNVPRKHIHGHNGLSSWNHNLNPIHSTKSQKLFLWRLLKDSLGHKFYYLSIVHQHLSWLSNKKSGKEGGKAGNFYYRDDVIFASHCEKAHKILNSSFIHNRMLLRNFMSSKKRQNPYLKHIQFISSSALGLLKYFHWHWGHFYELHIWSFLCTRLLS